MTSGSDFGNNLKLFMSQHHREGATSLGLGDSSGGAQCPYLGFLSPLLSPEHSLFVRQLNSDMVGNEIISSPSCFI